MYNCYSPPYTLEWHSGDGYKGFLHAITTCIDIQRLIPLDRWDIDPLYSPHVDIGKIYARFAATIDDVDAFDNTLFKLPIGEAITMDPQSRILLEEVGCGS